MDRPSKYRGRGARLFQWTAWLLVAGFGLVGAGVFWLDRAPLGMPRVVITQFETRLDQMLLPTGMTAQIAELSIGLRDGFRPAVTLSGVTLGEPGTEPTVALDRLDAVLSAGRLIRGEPMIRALRLEGLALTVQSDAEGRLNVRLGERTVARGAVSASDLIGQMRRMLDHEPMARIATIGVDDLAFRFEDVRRKTAVSTTGGTLRLSRSGTELTVDLDMGEIAGLSDGTTIGRISAALTSDAPDGAARAEMAMRGIVPASVAGLAGPSPLSDLLSRLAAPVSLTLRAAMTAGGNLDELTGSVSVGEGTIALPGMAEPMPVDWMRGNVALNMARDRLDLTDLDLASQKIAFGGDLTLIASPDDPVSGPILAQVALSRLELHEPALFPDPVRFDGLWADAQYDRSSSRVSLGSLSLLQGDMRIEAMGRLAPETATAPQHYALDLSVQEADRAALLALWPPALKPGTRGWLTKNIHRGTLTDVHVALRSRDSGNPTVGATFRFKDAEVQPVTRMPPLRNGQGFGEITNNRLSIAVDSANLGPDEGGDIQLTNGLMQIEDLRVPDTEAQISFDAVGESATVLGFLSGATFADPSAPPQTSTGQFSPADATGTIALTTRLRVPLERGTKGEDIGVAATGTLVGFTNDTIVPGKDLVAGVLAIDATSTRVQVTGPVTLNDLPLSIDFARAIGPAAADQPGSVVTVKTPLTAALVKEFRVPLPQGAVSGAGRITAVITSQPNTRPMLELTGDLTGNALSIPSLGIATSRTSGGSLRVEGQLGARTSLSKIDLRTPGLTLAASAELPGQDQGGTAGGGGALSFQRLQIGRWLDAPGRVGAGTGGSAGPVVLTSGTVDLRYAPFGKSKGAAGARPPVTLDLDRLVISDDIALTGVRGALTAGGAGDLTAAVNGKAQVAVRVDGAATGGAIQITSADAGAVFAAAGIFANARGGTLNLRLDPQPGAGMYHGTLRVQHTSLRESPTITELLSAISVVGAIEQMSGEGITFSDVRSNFDMAPGRIKIQSASAEGPSLGLSMDGAVDLVGKTVDLQGVVSPIYFLNQLGSFMTRRGEGLLGVSYTLRGPMAKPKVAVNPLSMLTPGFLREIFRRPISSSATESGN
ncbi:AsmA-like C-terminal region-containing protein [Pseudoruegeria sp. SK021]|uniref:YhdP family protein n=1 Tax=Pseudoruegeria sp. SK021 TaxID=1933035 RepID=UPI000A23BB71|nr:AsmA-like C-terminal region-containing protein [Pseudoruegeria sp. SK021]OSP56232.1 hypothetical protein BV911_02765 [Pseudoruegeria sp. SK021]